MDENMRLIPSINEALIAMEVSGGNAKVAQGSNNDKSASNPLTQKLNLNKSNKGSVSPPPDNSNRTGCSISNGAYLNMNAAQK